MIVELKDVDEGGKGGRGGVVEEEEGTGGEGAENDGRRKEKKPFVKTVEEMKEHASKRTCDPGRGGSRG